MKIGIWVVSFLVSVAGFAAEDYKALEQLFKDRDAKAAKDRQGDNAFRDQNSARDNNQKIANLRRQAAEQVQVALEDMKQAASEMNPPWRKTVFNLDPKVFPPVLAFPTKASKSENKTTAAPLPSPSPSRLVPFDYNYDPTIGKGVAKMVAHIKGTRAGFLGDLQSQTERLDSTNPKQFKTFGSYKHEPPLSERFDPIGEPEKEFVATIKALGDTKAIGTETVDAVLQHFSKKGLKDAFEIKSQADKTPGFNVNEFRSLHGRATAEGELVQDWIIAAKINPQVLAEGFTRNELQESIKQTNRILSDTAKKLAKVQALEDEANDLEKNPPPKQGGGGGGGGGGENAKNDDKKKDKPKNEGNKADGKGDGKERDGAGGTGMANPGAMPSIGTPNPVAAVNANSSDFVGARGINGFEPTGINLDRLGVDPSRFPIASNTSPTNQQTPNVVSAKGSPLSALGRAAVAAAPTGGGPGGNPGVKGGASGGSNSLTGPLGNVGPEYGSTQLGLTSLVTPAYTVGNGFESSGTGTTQAFTDQLAAKTPLAQQTVSFAESRGKMCGVFGPCARGIHVEMCRLQKDKINACSNHEAGAYDFMRRVKTNQQEKI